MNRYVRTFCACGLAALLIACGKKSTPVTPAADDRSASVNAVVNRVEARAAASAELAPVSNGYVLTAGGQIQTGEAASARLDFADGTFIRLTQKSSLTLRAVNPGPDPLKRLQLEIGAIWVNLTDGTLEVETPVARVSVRGSFAVIQYTPGDPADPDDDLLVVDCLEGSCAVENETTTIELGNMERAVLNVQGRLRMTLTGAEAQAFLKENPEARGLVETLTAAPPATSTGTATSVPTPTSGLSTAEKAARTAVPAASATDTPAPVSTATPIVLATPTSTSTATSAPTPTLSAAILGRHIVRAGENLLCIARAYAVSPEAIAQVNGLAAPNFPVTTGQTLRIPSVRWTDVLPGPVCTPQFNSPFKPLPTTPPIIVTRTPTPSATITPSPTATCEPGHFYDPFQKRCRPPDTPAPLVTDTPTITPTPPPTNTPTITPTPPPTNTPTITPTPSQTNTPLPDTLGPNITQLTAVPPNLDGPTTCSVTFQVTMSDSSGVAFSNPPQPDPVVNWTSSGGPSGSVPLTLVSGDVFNGDWSATLNNVSVPAGGTLTWNVLAYDVVGNFQSARGPDVRNNGVGACP